MAGKKTTCPYCGRKYVNIENHQNCTKWPKGAPPPWEVVEKEAAKESPKKGKAEKKAAKKAAKKATKSKKTTKKDDEVNKKEEVPKKGTTKPKKTVPKKVSTARARKKALETALLALIQAEEPISKYDLWEMVVEDDGLNFEEADVDIALQNMFKNEEIKRNRVLDRGGWVYEFTINNDGKDVESGKKKWETMGNCPCFICPSLDKCNIGQNRYNPHYCEHMTQWLICQRDNTSYAHKFKPITENIK